MSNGIRNCAIEACCTKPQKLAKIAESTGLELQYCATFLKWMDDHGLIFAPSEFQVTIDAILNIERENHSHK
jgi:hypothetical protein